MQYFAPGWSVRFGEALMPKVANGIYLDADIARARADNLEFEFHPGLFRRNPTAIRLLSYVNHADMGKYREAIQRLPGRARDHSGHYRHPAAGPREIRLWGEPPAGPAPYGLQAYGRWGWNDGRNESFAYTEVDRTGSLGMDWRGGPGGASSTS